MRLIDLARSVPGLIRLAERSFEYDAGSKEAGMFTRAPLLVVFLTLCSTLVGCSSLEAALAGLEKPTARVVGADLKGLTLDGVLIDFDVEVRNPYRVPLPVGSLQYALASEGKQFLSGEAPSQGSIPARGIKNLRAPVTVRFGDILSAVQGVRPGRVVPYSADLTLGLDVPADFGGPVSVPISKEGEVPIPAPPRIEVRDVSWDELTYTSAKGKVVLDITNLNEFDAALTRFHYAIGLGGKTIASAKARNLPALAAGETGEMVIPLNIKPIDFGLAIFGMLQGDEASYSLKGDMGVKTRFGSIDVPIDQSGKSTVSK